MAIIFPYSNSIAVVTSLAVLPLYHWIPLYNGLMITSRTNVVVIPLYHDSDYQLCSYSYVSSGYAKKIKISCVLAINYYCTGYAAQALFLQNRHFLVLDDMGFPLYRAGTVLCIHVTRCTFINWLLKLNQTANELQFTNVFLLDFLQPLFTKYFYCQRFFLHRTHNYINIDTGIGGAVEANAPTQKIVWGHCPHTLPSSYYKHIKYFYIVRFVNLTSS